MIRVEQVPDHPEVREKLREILLDLYQKMEVQGWQRSRSEGQNFHQCLYRGPEGRCCMVGHLIPREEFEKVPEKSVGELLAEDCEAARRLRDLSPGLRGSDWGYVLERLQTVHDSALSGREMKIEFLAFAELLLGQPLYKETP